MTALKGYVTHLCDGCVCVFVMTVRVLKGCVLYLGNGGDQGFCKPHHVVVVSVCLV